MSDSKVLNKEGTGQKTPQEKAKKSLKKSGITPSHLRGKSQKPIAPNPDDGIKSKPQSSPGGGDFPRYDDTLQLPSDKASLNSTHVRYSSTLASRLVYYRQRFVTEKASIYKELDIHMDEEGFEHLMGMIDTFTYEIKKEHPTIGRLNKMIDLLLNRVEQKLPFLGNVMDYDIVKAFKAELHLIKNSRGALQDNEEDRIYPDDSRNEDFDATRGMLYSMLGLDEGKEKEPGGSKSIKASLFEKNMPIDSAVTYLYDLLITKRPKNKKLNKASQSHFIKIMRLLSRPDIQEVEHAFIRHRENQKQKITLREAIAGVYGTPSTKPQGSPDWFSHWVYNERPKYLFELLDNGGKASTPTRVAISLGLMDKNNWKKFITHQDEVTRLAEELEPNELVGFWGTYQHVLYHNLNDYNFQRIENLVKANQNYARIKTIAKTWEKENAKDKEDQDKDKLDENATKLGNWQTKILAKAYGKDNKISYPFLEAKDLQLEGIIKNYTAGANKFTGKFGVRGFVKGKIKDLKKEVVLWNKAVIKEEKKYFNKYPVIRRYVLGEKIEFKPTGTEDKVIEILPQKTHTKNILTPNMKSGWDRARQYKIGWNAADRTTMKVLLEAGLDKEAIEEIIAEEKKDQSKAGLLLNKFVNFISFCMVKQNAEEAREETDADGNATEYVDIDENNFKKSRQILAKVEKTIRARGLDFDAEMLQSLAEIAGQAKIRKHWFSINRRQDLFKALMKLPDRWRVQFMDAFIDTPIEEAKDANEADQLANQALNTIRMVLIGLGMLPKQVFEAIGRLKYGTDITPNYLKLRRSAGLRNHRRGMREYTATHEIFLPKKVLQFAYLLNPKELRIAKEDQEMHVGLERQFAKYLPSASIDIQNDDDVYDNIFDLVKIEQVRDLFLQLAEHIGITPILEWEDIQKNTKNQYKELAESTTTDTKKWKKKTKSSKANKNASDKKYLNYYVEYIGQKKDSDKAYSQAADNAKKDRRNQEEDLENLVKPEDMEVSGEVYKKRVDFWSKSFASEVESTDSYRKMMRMALIIWQEGDEVLLPSDYNAAPNNPYANNKEKRKEAFLYEVYHHMKQESKDRLAKKTKLNLHEFYGFTKHKIDLVGKLENEELDIVQEIIKSNFRWYRSGGSKEKEYGEGSFTLLRGRVLLEAWTDINDPAKKDKVEQRRKKQAEVTNLKEELKLSEKSEEQPDEEKLGKLADLQEEFAKLDLEVRNKYIPMPSKDRLEQLRATYTNKGTYVDVVKDLFMHLSNAVEYDKAFVDAMLAAGYRPDDLMTLTETYKYLAAQEKEKFLKGAASWSWFTIQATERREGTSRLLSAMRNIEEARDSGKTHSSLGDEKGYFYDTFFDDVEDRQENFEKTTAKYRKNLLKTIWLIGTIVFIPFGPAGFGASALLDELILPLAFAGLGTVTSVVNSTLDPYKNRITGLVGETTLAAIKGAMISAVFYASFILKDLVFAADGWGESINSLESAVQDGDNSKKWELLQKQALEYAGRKAFREVGKETIRGLETAIKEGPKAGLVNVKKELLNPALILEIFAKTAFKGAFGNAASGASKGLDQFFGGKGTPLNELAPEDRPKEFRASEARRTVRRELFNKSGLKKLVKTAEYAVSNRNPAFRTFNEKFDVNRHMPMAQEHVERLKAKEIIDDPLDEIKTIIFNLNNRVAALKAIDARMVGNKDLKQDATTVKDKRNEDAEQVTELSIDYLDQLATQIIENNPTQAREFALTLEGAKGFLAEIDATIQAGTGLDSEVEDTHELGKSGGGKPQIAKKGSEKIVAKPKVLPRNHQATPAPASILQFLTRLDPGWDQIEQNERNGRGIVGDGLGARVGEVQVDARRGEIRQEDVVPEPLANEAGVLSNRGLKIIQNDGGMDARCFIYSIIMGLTGQSQAEVEDTVSHIAAQVNLEGGWIATDSAVARNVIQAIETWHRQPIQVIEITPANNPNGFIISGRSHNEDSNARRPVVIRSLGGHYDAVVPQ
ncbi:hypothetical protein BKI52_20035 [marine bacterium AO1-C]|nr:hypothetical protein BKI52_20035 [marine bacterium AO1-C]